MVVLVVEDDHDHRAVIRLTLHLAGHDVWDAASAEEALTILDGYRRPDVVVVDVRLPGLDGLELLTLIRSSAELAKLPVVLCSAHAESSARDAARDDPRTTFVGKPYHPDALIDALTGAVELASDRGQPAASR